MFQTIGLSSLNFLRPPTLLDYFVTNHQRWDKNKYNKDLSFFLRFYHNQKSFHTQIKKEKYSLTGLQPYKIILMQEMTKKMACV